MNGVFNHTVQEKLAGWYFMTLFFSYTSLFLNTTIIYDLKKVINNPFQSSEKRIKKYMIMSVLGGIFFCTLGLKLTVSHNSMAAEWNYRLYQLICLSNCALATQTVVWLTFRFKKPGMSGDLKKEIRARYIEYVVLYAIFSWPICYVTKPSYRFVSTLNSYIGGTIYVESWFGGLVLLSGFLIAASRMRDRLL